MNTPAAQQATDEGPLEQAAPSTGAAFGQQSMRRYHSLEQPSLRSSHQNILAPSTANQLSLRPASAPLPPSADAATGSSTHRRAGRSKAARQVGNPLLRTQWQNQDEARKERNRQTAAASRQRRLDRQAALEQRVAELELENERLTALLAAHGIQDDSTIRHGGSQPAPAPAGQSPGPPGAATLQVPSCPACLVCQAAVFAALTRETSLPLGNTLAAATPPGSTLAPATTPVSLPSMHRAPANANTLQESALAMSAAAASAASELAFELGLGSLPAPAQAPVGPAASQGSAPNSRNDAPTSSTLTSPPRPTTAQRASSLPEL
ncbi:hypothetical protein D9Q98_003373 [Chlorella vulgaris]|uniref:BZIP domain-containing protein n=1 Tax=Chlorella vulgaris TaxID=3077 RepID=A0A9D4YYF3_CHLVU|nr:hypothetical protein D9Q98_003373 [Chlorella vulgaris]